MGASYYDTSYQPFARGRLPGPNRTDSESSRTRPHHAARGRPGPIDARHMQSTGGLPGHHTPAGPSRPSLSAIHRLIVVRSGLGRPRSGPDRCPALLSADTVQPLGIVETGGHPAPDLSPQLFQPCPWVASGGPNGAVGRSARLSRPCAATVSRPAGSHANEPPTTIVGPRRRHPRVAGGLQARSRRARSSVTST